MKPVRILMFANVWDAAHDVMGFLPSWARALQAQGAEVIVVAQDVSGDVSGMRVVSLEKRRLPGRIGRVFRAYARLWRSRHEYDVLFVVMAPTWALLLSPFVRLTGKRSYLWYAVWRGSWKLRLAERVVNGIFCSVPESFPFKSAKVHAVGQAIDTERFSPGGAVRVPGQVLYVGRISAVKRIELLLEALTLLPEPPDFRSILIAGGPLSARDRDYERGLRASAHRSGLEEALVWLGPVGHDTAHELYRRADIAVNMTPAGSFDKTILEAMASGAIAVASNPALRAFLPDAVAERILFQQDDAADCARVLSGVAGMSDADKDALRVELREAVVRHHSIARWARNIISILG